MRIPYNFCKYSNKMYFYRKIFALLRESVTERNIKCVKNIRQPNPVVTLTVQKYFILVQLLGDLELSWFRRSC